MMYRMGGKASRHLSIPEVAVMVRLMLVGSAEIFSLQVLWQFFSPQELITKFLN